MSEKKQINQDELNIISGGKQEQNTISYEELPDEFKAPMTGIGDFDHFGPSD